MTRGKCADPIKDAERLHKISNKLTGVPKSEIHKQHLSQSDKNRPRGKDAYNWKGGDTPFVCTICGKEILIRHVEISTRKTCGDKKCLSQIFSKRTGEANPSYKPKVKKVCPICQKNFEVKISHAELRVCCSHKCMGLLRSQTYVGEKNPTWVPKIKLNCKGCGKEIERLESALKFGKVYGRFCSVSCLAAWRSKNICLQNHPSWKGGTSFKPYCIKFNDNRRTATRKFFHNKCIICGDEGTHFRRRLHVHHIDHDKDQGCNGKPFNLVPLCHSCHAHELGNISNYAAYINKTLEEGFKWGIWSREQYMIDVMYPE